MSYLAALRLHFAGQFQAAPSTVNNDPQHFDNATFRKQYQQPQDSSAANGWWNPRGNADWRLIGCAVTGAQHADGSPADAGDPVLTMLVADSDRQVAAKLADLDPEQQLCSVIWGLEVRICDARGTTLVRGRFAPAAFTDIWDRAQGPGAAGDIGACAAYQSVLTDLEWGAVGGSRVRPGRRQARDQHDRRAGRGDHAEADRRRGRARPLLPLRGDQPRQAARAQPGRAARRAAGRALRVRGRADPVRARVGAAARRQPEDGELSRRLRGAQRLRDVQLHVHQPAEDPARDVQRAAGERRSG